MSVNYHINKVSPFVDILATGCVTTTELMQMYESLIAQSDYGPTLPVLTDLTEVHTLDVSLEGIVSVFAIADQHKLGRKNAKSAVVVNDEGHALFAKMSAALAEQSENIAEIGIFYTRSDALAWLGVEERGAISA